MTIARKGFIVRFTPQMIERVDAVKGRLSRNKWIEALVGRELNVLERERDEYGDDPVVVGVPTDAALSERMHAEADISETGEPSGLSPLGIEALTADPHPDDASPGEDGEDAVAPTSADEDLDWWK